MSVRTAVVMIVLLVSCGVCHARTDRWSNFAEDSDLKYYLDQNTIISLPDNVYIFWVKSVPKSKDYFKVEYNMNDASYMFTSYELDCAVSSYRLRGSIMYDKNHREINKSIPESEPSFEPIPPESMLELAQDELCVKQEGRAESTGAAGKAAPPAAGSAGARKAPAGEAASTEAPAAPGAPPAAPAETEEAPELQ